jgi:hypothetical protein
MGYSSQSTVVFGAVILGKHILKLQRRIKRSTQSEESSDPKKYDEDYQVEKNESARVAGEGLGFWLQCFSRDLGLHLWVEDLTTFEEYGNDENDLAIEERNFAIFVFEKRLTADLWGHEASGKRSSFVHMRKLQPDTEERAKIDQLLLLLELHPSEYPTQVILMHSAG